MIPDNVWSWAGWHVVKWVFGSVLLILLLTIIWKLSADVTALNRVHQEMINGIQKLIYDTPLNDADTIKAIADFIEGRI